MSRRDAGALLRAGQLIAQAEADGNAGQKHAWEEIAKAVVLLHFARGKVAQ